MPDAGPASGCAFVLRQPGTGLSSPMFGSVPAGQAPVPSAFGGFFNKIGFKSTRLVITPRFRSGSATDNNYNLDLAPLNAASPPGQPFLPCAIRRPEYQEALSATASDLRPR
jgi:hypothetical protein